MGTGPQKTRKETDSELKELFGSDDDGDDEPNAQSAPPTTPLDSPPPPGLALEALQIIPSKQIIFQIKYILKLGRPIGFILNFKIKILTKLDL